MRTEERALGLAERLPRHGRRLAGPLCASCLVFAATAGPAVADTFRVTRHDDPPPAGCAPWDCSLREAVNAANGKPGSTIQLSSGTYRLTRPRSLGGKIDSGKPGSDKGDLDVTASAQIATRGSGEVTIDANGGVTGDRVLEVHGGGTVLRGIKLTGGKASVDRDGHGRGGGVRVDAGALYMFGGAVIGNSVPRQGDLGGGIYTADHAVLRRVEVSGNTATGGFGGFGGGVYTASPGATEIYDSKLFANRAFAGGALASEDGHSANVTVARSQIAHNVASGLGGAAYLLGPPTEGGIRYVFENTTINANAADEGGGALRLRNATATLRSSTVVRNTAHNVGGVVVRDDGHDRTSVTLGGTILASNTEQNPTPPAAPDCFDETGGLCALRATT